MVWLKTTRHVGVPDRDPRLRRTALQLLNEGACYGKVVEPRDRVAEHQYVQ